MWLPLQHSLLHFFLYLVLSFNFSWKMDKTNFHTLSSFLPPISSFFGGWFCLLFPRDLCASVSCQLKTTPCGSVPHCECFTCWTFSLLPITLKSGHRDLCRLCSWHRFKATSREPAGCFTLQINLTTGGIIVRGRRAGTWTPSWALLCLVIYHNLTTLVLMLLPSGDESFLFHSGYLSACDIDCCHIILKEAIMIHDCLKERLVWVVFSLFLTFKK